MRERLRISPSCPLILSFHVALDQAREKYDGDLKARFDTLYQLLSSLKTQGKF